MRYCETSDADLNRYLDDISRGDDEHEWCNRRAEGYWDQDDNLADRLEEAWRRIMGNDHEKLFALDVAAAFIGHPGARAARAERLLYLIESKIEDEFIVMAGEELDDMEPDYDEDSPRVSRYGRRYY
jgi:hypothetical protein